MQRLLELRTAKRNEAWAREQGAIEYGANHYWMFVTLHTAWFCSIATEHFMRGQPVWHLWPLALGLLFGTQVLRYWSIVSLGRYWNTKILVVPGAKLVTSGPYRWLKHPNYVAVVLEIALVPALLEAWYTAAIFTVLNAVILLTVRIPDEEQALENQKSPLE